LGGGGSILTVPVLVYVLGYDPKLAITMSLPIVGLTSAVGTWRHWRAGNVHFGRALAFGLTAMVSAFGAARASSLIQGSTQLILLGIAMLAAAVSMLRSAGKPAAVAATAGPTRPTALFYGVGLAVGALTGLVGIGGGFLIVPALVIAGGVAMREAVGTSLLVITLNCIAGFAGQRAPGSVPWTFVLPFTGVAMGGIFAGAALLPRVSQPTLKRGFATLLMVIAILVLWQNRGRF
jgi:uncharacterized membrane protein YfcA